MTLPVFWLISNLLVSKDAPVWRISVAALPSSDTGAKPKRRLLLGATSVVSSPPLTPVYDTTAEAVCSAIVALGITWNLGVLLLSILSVRELL